MLNLIPHFIHQQYKVKNLSGELMAAVMFVDISGFTSITEAMMRQGKEGAEALSYILNNVFGAVIEQIYRRGGFISSFAGDSVTAIFSAGDRLQPFFAALAIQRIFQKKGLGKSKFGDFPLSVKVALSYGGIGWGIVGAGRRRAYYFRGEAVEDGAKTIGLANPGEIVLAESYHRRLGGDRSRQGEMTIAAEEKPLPARLTRLNKQVARHFLPQEILSVGLSGEFRDIVPVFISFESGLDGEELGKLTDMVMEQTADFGGFFNGLDFGDKGATFFVIFGAPKGYEDNIERAVKFALAVREESEVPLRQGICCGTVYAGVIGSRRRCNYTGLGDIVNLSARFMQGAGPGQIWVSAEVASKVSATHIVKELGKHAFKGKSEPVAVFELVAAQAVSREQLFAGQMVGREKELAEAKKLCQPALEGNFGGVFYIYGEPGIGKSRFLYELSKGLEPKIKTLVLQADSILRKSMNPFIYLLRRYFHQTETNKYEENLANFEDSWNELMSRLQGLKDKVKVEPILKELKRTKSLLGALLGLFWKGSLYQELDPKGRFQNTIYALKEFFKAESLVQPLALAFEDIHWIDSDSLETVRVLSRRVDDFPIILLGISRLNDDGSKPVFVLDDEVKRTEMTIEHLPQEAVDAFIRARLGQAVSRELLRFIIARTEGNPFYIEQFCLYLRENALIELKDDHYRLVREDLEIPEGIRPILIARLDRLSQELRELVQKAAVLGREFEVQILSQMLAGRTLDRLLAKGEQEAIWSALSEILYIFKHALLRDAAYEMQLKRRLRQLHRTAADAIKTVYGDAPAHLADLAFHYERAEMEASAKEYLQKAGDFAKESYKNEEAVNLYQRLLKHIGDFTEEIAINSKLASILVLTGDWERAKDIYSRNLELAEKLGEEAGIASAKIELGKHLHSRGDYPEAFRLSEEALETYTKLGRQEGVKDALSILGLIYCDQGENDRSLEAYQNALQIAEATEDKTAAAGLFGNIGNIYLQAEQYPKAMECYRRCLRLSEETGDLRSMGLALVNIGITHAMEGEFDRALEYFQKQSANASTIGDKQGISGVMANTGWVQSSIGNYREALGDFQELLRNSEELNDVAGISFAEYSIANIRKEFGEYADAEKHYLRAIDIGRRIQLKYYLCSYLYDMADLQLQMKKPELSQTLAREALAIAQEVRKKEAIVSSEILLAKIVALTDLAKAIDQLKGLLTSAADEDSGKAHIHYELCRLTGEESERKEALALYRRLYEKIPLRKYQDRIEELESNAD